MKGYYDRWILVSTLALLTIGLLMVASASMVISDRQYGYPFHYLIRQSVYLVLGLVLAWVVTKIPIKFWKNGEVSSEDVGFDEQKNLTKLYTEHAVDFINRNHKDPFLLYVPHSMPHVPIFTSKEFEGKSGKGVYGDVIMELDWSMGEIVRTLKEEGVYKNTIIVFTSDNGPELGSANPLRGKKAQTWEGGQRVPAIITWPNKIPSGIVTSEMISTLDLFPTFAKVSNTSFDNVGDLDGDNILEFLKQPQSVKLKERPLYFYARNGNLEAIRLGNWKLHISKSLGWNIKEKGEFKEALYNLKDDIGEKLNVADKYPGIVKKLKQQMLDFDSEF